LAAAEIAIATAKNHPEELSSEARKREIEQTKAEEFDSAWRVRSVCTADILLGRLATVEKLYPDAKGYFDDAEAQLNRLSLQPKTLEGTLAEARAKMYLADGKPDMAKKEYSRSIQCFSEAISSNCKRVAALTKTLQKLSAG
jgi:tetratricopeptide (TPR) repeat protein